MRIYIKEKGKIGLFIPVPLWFLRAVCNEKFIKFILKYMEPEQRKYIESIDFGKLSKVLKMLKEYKGLEMVNVEDSKGTKVKIVV
ncbi:hypothetical protein [Clostridium ganghwense]|uniref:MarR family transcriptional regulator n=1 Tax=Clostridium ganghwense TaxID=312089 RepID=A0ABT4CR06_9CLOT|nr:hypothetical protein [Clostridium ganghwense]MCY6371495.1 hypothetical protein [Clostridium ganghwense]